MAEPEELSRTEALCPVCLRRLSAARERRGGEVWLVRTCPEHGRQEAVIWRGLPDFDTWRRPKAPSALPQPQTRPALGCPFDCGLCPEHSQRTCTAVVEVTSRCDLCCPVCYASSGPTATPEPSVPALAQRLANLRREAGPCNVQLSGGEPTTRGDLPEIIAAARAQGFGLVQLNTNGLRLGTEPGYACRLAQAGLQSVFLQFDGTDEACQVLRGRPLMREKLAALDACAEAGLAVVLVPTLLRGVNDQALGAILRLAQERMPVVRGVHFQPASSFGRFPGRMAESQRLTLPEVLTLLVAQSAGLLRAEDFHPPCCEHERCSFSGSFTLQGGRFVPLSGGGCCDTAPITAAPATAAPITAAPISAAPISAAPITAAEGARRAMASVAGQWAAAPAPSTAPALDDFERFLASRGPQTRLALSCMAFQDAQTLDLERVRGCCIHTLAPDGRLVPFCLYNLTATDGTPLYRRSQ